MLWDLEVDWKLRDHRPYLSIKRRLLLHEYRYHSILSGPRKNMSNYGTNHNVRFEVTLKIKGISSIYLSAALWHTACPESWIR